MGLYIFSIELAIGGMIYMFDKDAGFSEAERRVESNGFSFNLTVEFDEPEEMEIESNQQGDG